MRMKVKPEEFISMTISGEVTKITRDSSALNSSPKPEPSLKGYLTTTRSHTKTAGDVLKISTTTTQSPIHVCNPKMKLLSILFYYLGDIASHTIARWSWGGWVYQRLMLLSVECDKDFEIWKEVKPRKKRRKRK